MLTIAPPRPCCEHLTQLVLQAEEDRSQVDGDDLVEHLHFDVRQPLPLQLDGCSVDGAVQAPERLDRSPNEVLDGARVGDVGGEELGLAPGIFDHPHGLVAALRGEVGHGDSCSGCGERHRDRSTHAACRTGDQGHLAGEVLVAHLVPPFLDRVYS